MYIPNYYQINDYQEIKSFIEKNNFAVIVSTDNGCPIATHIPVMVTEKDNDLYISGHFARGNKQWGTIDDNDNILVIFLLGFFIFTLWEYLVAVVLEKLFKTKYWDYSHLKFNFQGRICLKNSIYWGILGVLLVFVIQPVVENLTNAIPENVSIIILSQSICTIVIGVDMPINEPTIDKIKAQVLTVN